uniref:acetyl-CoA carboxylase carboxyltransferase beta subunit n=1 Tax=Lonicera x heckrottii TaxID=2875971 RepID=UPI001D121684|nr:acetyl-CoA carboxylase carboxyltransferase beta subunit [Lonicera x heckrottii]UAM95711.1 acetyl-CoA carboxylase carboxyltransferase beta subunit [Lonicera x heckrottii]
MRKKNLHSDVFRSDPKIQILFKVMSREVERRYWESYSAALVDEVNKEIELLIDKYFPEEDPGAKEDIEKVKAFAEESDSYVQKFLDGPFFRAGGGLGEKAVATIRALIYKYFPTGHFDVRKDREKLEECIKESTYIVERSDKRDPRLIVDPLEKALAMTGALIYKYFRTGHPDPIKDREKLKAFDEELKYIVEEYKNRDPRGPREKVKAEIRLELNELHDKNFPNGNFVDPIKDREKLEEYFKKSFRILERYPKDPSYGGDPQEDDSDSGSDTDDSDSGSDTDDPFYGSDTDDSDFGSDTDDPFYGSDMDDPFYGSDMDDPFYGSDTYGPLYGSDTDDPFYGSDTDDHFYESDPEDYLQKKRNPEGDYLQIDRYLEEACLKIERDPQKIDRYIEEPYLDYGSNPHDPSYGGDPPEDDPSYGGDPPEDDSSYGGDPPEDDSSYGGDPPEDDSSYGGDPPEDDSSYGGDPPEDDSSYGGDPPEDDSDSGGDPPEDDSSYGGDPPEDDSSYGGDPPEDDSDSGGDPPEDDSSYGGDPPEDDSSYGGDPPEDDSDSGGDPPEDDSDSGGDPNPRENYTHKYKHLWLMCDECYTLNYRRFLKEKLYICEGCGFHLKMNSSERLKLLIDPDTWDPMNEKMASLDPIEFHSEEDPYIDRINSYQKKTGLTEAIQTGLGQLNGIPIAMGVMEFGFMGGSMGSVVGEKITRLVEYATNQSLPLIIVCASGGARMQEGSLSLMQMAKISSSLYDFQTNKKLFYVAILTSPTTGGVTASFGMLGDVIVAEPDAYIAFAGKRVIELTLNKEVPEGSQETEYLFEKGLFDLVIPRKNLKSILNEVFGSHGFFPLILNQNHSSITEH